MPPLFSPVVYRSLQPLGEFLPSLVPFRFMELDSLSFQWRTVFDSLSDRLSTPSLTPCRLGFILIMEHVDLQF